MFTQFITDIMNYKLQKNLSKWPPFALIQCQSLLGHSSIAVRTTSIGNCPQLLPEPASVTPDYCNVLYRLKLTTICSPVD